MKLSKKELEIINHYFSDKPVIRAYVFGSYARGDANEQSDVDLLIDWDYSQPIGWGYVSAWRELKLILKKDVDFVSVKWIDPLLKDAIHKDRQLIYERKTE